MMRIMLTLAVLFTVSAHARTRQESTSTPDYFKVDGKKATAEEADLAAKDHDIQQCKYIKNSEPAAYKCQDVVKEYSARNGQPRWKRP